MQSSGKLNSKDPLAIEHISVACAMSRNITYLQQMNMSGHDGSMCNADQY